MRAISILCLAYDYLFIYFICFWFNSIDYHKSKTNGEICQNFGRLSYLVLWERKKVFAKLRISLLLLDIRRWQWKNVKNECFRYVRKRYSTHWVKVFDYGQVKMECQLRMPFEIVGWISSSIGNRCKNRCCEYYYFTAIFSHSCASLPSVKNGKNLMFTHSLTHSLTHSFVHKHILTLNIESFDPFFLFVVLFIFFPRRFANFYAEDSNEWNEL